MIGLFSLKMVIRRSRALRHRNGPQARPTLLRSAKVATSHYVQPRSRPDGYGGLSLRQSQTQRVETEMRHAIVGGLALILSLAVSNSGKAEPMKTSTPTTRILAIGTINPGTDQAKVLAILPNEVRETVNLYLDGKIEQWYSL